jgi:hypothetical protein
MEGRKIGERKRKGRGKEETKAPISLSSRVVNDFLFVYTVYSDLVHVYLLSSPTTSVLITAKSIH